MDETSNSARIVTSDNEYFWVSKTQIQYVKLPTYSGNPIPTLESFKDFLVYCTQTKIGDFSTDVMSTRAKELLVDINSIIEANKANFIPKT